MLTQESQPVPNQNSKDSLERAIVLIPARNPDHSFPTLIESLLQRGFCAVIVVDDGSSPGFYGTFESLSKWPQVHLLQHPANLGKGRALKTGMSYASATFATFDVLVTADADGQHTAHDIERVTRAALQALGRIILGSREFAKDVPLRNRIGNELTRHIFTIVTGVKLLDTQTGLRAFPRSLLPELTPLKGERYEYEMSVLVHLCRTGRTPLDLTIKTIYIDGNRSSHFDPVRDSARIFFVLARGLFSSQE